jgi:RNA polymerase sigma-70 factor, ECF subfamily
MASADVIDEAVSKERALRCSTSAKELHTRTTPLRDAIWNARKRQEACCSNLMRKGLAGDEAAYNQLLTTLSDRLGAIIRSKSRRYQMAAADIDDIIQETLIAVHTQRHRWNPSLPLMPWAATIARNKIVDEIRRRNRNRCATAGDVSQICSGATSEEGNSLAKYDVERLINCLPKRSQEIVAAIALNRDSAREVAARLGMLEVTVRVTHHRSLKYLAKKLASTK